MDKEVFVISDAEKGWVAGILDFQAHVTYKKNSQRAADSQQITMYVQTSVRNVIERLSSLTGTNPEWKPHKDPPRDGWDRKGCVEHCPEAHIHNTLYAMPDIAKWCVTGVALAIVLWNVRDHMVTTHEPWDWALTQCLGQVKLTGRGASAVHRAIDRYREHGWDIPPVLGTTAALAAAESA